MSQHAPANSTTGGATDQVIAASVPTNSSLPAGSPGHNAPTSSQASAAASLPADSPGLQQMTDTSSKASSTTSTSKVAPTLTDSTTSSTAATAKPHSKIVTLFITLFGLAWVVFGLAAFFMSLVCFGFSGSVSEKIFGVLAAIIMGPFFWIYYFSDAGYCKKMAPTLF